MKLSVIIVNYNVKYFIEQCLFSVLQSIKNIDGEIIVVDNNSVDGSQALIQEKFPSVNLICNTVNVGFSKATNQGIKESAGEYILCLNPDTVLEESTLEQCIAFMDSHPDAGGMGPKMIDGKGNYLPESKRGIPTTQTAFYKISGLIKLFPNSPLFARYYLGHLPINETNKIEILTGSFMFLRRTALDKTGLFDEVFFMYGEDIDLSYRILKAGYSNYYFPGTTIIHYRGESTKKSTVNYVLIFYKAMKIFTQKHFANSNGWLFVLLINLAINLRAMLSILKRLVIRSIPVLLDAFTFFGIIFGVTEFWEKVYFQGSSVYPHYYKFTLIPAYVLIWILGLTFSKGYHSPIKLNQVFKGALFGAIGNLVIYALVPASFHFSRAIILISSVFIFGIALINRYLLNFTGVKDYSLVLKKNKRFAIVGYEIEAERVKNILIKSGIVPDHIEFVLPLAGETHINFACNISQLSEIVKLQRIDEVIFCAKDITSEDIIKNMKLLSVKDVDIKIASPDSLSVIGSNSTKAAGDLYLIKIDDLKN